LLLSTGISLVHRVSLHMSVGEGGETIFFMVDYYRISGITLYIYKGGLDYEQEKIV